ncbi:YbiR family transporter [Luteibacter rhizovicinus]|uniref:YbiR family transporter n=1 Tax=Luteibacter rhizovicinus TaxID=242606 RepID=A0A4R3YQW4_9GAMM|nr:SLC13 family permease [Luteibacter rhizovicinus]TCV94018.1 YbiR family transporter [Luteibacter rhizovicinus]
MGDKEGVLRWVPESIRGLRHDYLFLALLAALVVLTAISPGKIAGYPGLVDWRTIATLTGLLILTKAVEMSGALHRIGSWLIERTATRRMTALVLVLVTAVLSMLVTNDVSLFVMVPLTLSMCRAARMPATKLVVFEALAVNAGSALTPIGNPQNLFIWQQWGNGFGSFVWSMAPLVAMLFAMLIVLTAVSFPATALKVHDHVDDHVFDRHLLTIAALLYLPFLVLADMHYTTLALAAVLVVFLVVRRDIVARIDWGLLIVFVLMFVDLRLLAGLPSVHDFIGGLGLADPKRLYVASALASQGISNVPAAIALAEYSQNWKVIAWGVSVGGFGFILGSLANLIALRLLGERRAWITFHLYSGPFFVVAAVLGYLLLRV